MVQHSPTHECNPEKTNKLNLSPTPPSPPPPLTSIYTDPKKSPAAGQRSHKKKQPHSYLSSPYEGQCTICASAEWKWQLPAQSKSVEEDLGKEVPPLWKSKRIWSWKSPAEGSCPSQAVAGSECLCHRDLQRQVRPPTIWTGEFDQIIQKKGLADKEKQSVTLRNHEEREWTQQKEKKKKKKKRHSFHQVWAEDLVPTSFHYCWEDSCMFRWAEVYLDAVGFRIVPMLCNSIRDWWW